MTRGGTSKEQRLAWLHAKIDQDQIGTGCWIWTGTHRGHGYGVSKVNGRRYNAHRAVYLLLVGPIPDGLVLDHLCRNRRCVNPDHVEIVHSRENTLRGCSPAAVNARKATCHLGHPLDRINPKTGSRRCSTCSKEAVRRFQAKQRSAL